VATPDSAVATALNTAVGALTLGTNLFRGPIRPDEVNSIPTLSAFCLADSGPEPLDYLQGGAHTPQLKTFWVNVYIRSNAHEYEAGQTLARACRDALHDSPPSGYFASRVTSSEPFYLGMDEHGSHLFSITVRLMIQE
jgi:hypothetical protein